MIANVKAADPSVSDTALRDIREGVMEVIMRPSTKRKLIDAAVRVYARHFTDSDIRGMIRFYQTPLGKKVIRTLPAVTRESVLAGEAVVRPLRGALIQSVKEKLKRDHIDPRTLQPEKQ